MADDPTSFARLSLENLSPAVDLERLLFFSFSLEFRGRERERKDRNGISEGADRSMRRLNS